MEEEWRKREAELKEVPPQKARPEDWPKGVRTIGLDEMNALGVDANGTLYWHGKSVAIRRIELRNKELILAAFATVATVVQALVALFPKLPIWLATP
jgi:hypothetical protein